MIRDKHLNSISKNPLDFAEVLKRLNERGGSVQPSTLIRRLERKSNNVKDSGVIADFLREKGLSDDKIFTKQ